MYHTAVSIIFALGMFAGGALVSCSDHQPNEAPCVRSI
jgi:hypothetical protein